MKSVWLIFGQSTITAVTLVVKDVKVNKLNDEKCVCFFIFLYLK